MTTMTTETPTADHGDDVSAATAALRALAATDGGEVLAGQLSRLVAVIAHEAVRTKRFRTDLVSALVPGPAAGPAEGRDPAGVDVAPGATRTELNRMTKPELQRLIEREGMDPGGKIRSRSTKGQMIDLVLAFRASTSDAPAPDSPATEPPKRRRQPSPLDPYAVAASDGVEGLREQLQHLDVEQLKDIVAAYGMNNDRRAMGWTDHGRLVERILARTDFGATQGSAFRTAR